MMQLLILSSHNTPFAQKSSEMNQPYYEDDTEADYGEMYDGDVNEEFDEEVTKHPRSQDSPIPPRNQDSPIPSTTQYSPGIA